MALYRPPMEISPGLAQALSNVALGWYSRALNDSEAVKEIEAALARRDGIGSLAWRSRQVGEVLGG